MTTHRWLALWTGTRALAFLLVIAGCSVDGAAVGTACKSDSDCADLDDGACTDSGLCTRSCSVHRDCGCNQDGITTADIEAGACETSCNMTKQKCMRLCSTDDDCAGSARCRALDQYPYKTCW